MTEHSKENAENAKMTPEGSPVCPKGELEIEDNEEDYNLYEQINWRKPYNLGLFYDKALESFTHRMVFGAAAIYPFFGVYLNLPGHMFSAISSVFAMFWSLKFFWAFVIDSKSIGGKNRIYFMAIGKLLTSTSFLLKALLCCCRTGCRMSSMTPPLGANRMLRCFQ